MLIKIMILIISLMLPPANQTLGLKSFLYYQKGKSAYEIKNFKLAKNYFLKSKKCSPANISILLSLGNIYYEEKNYHNAQKIYILLLNKTIESSPAFEFTLVPSFYKKNLVVIYYNLGNTYFKQNNPVELLGKATVTVQVDEINPVTNSSFEVRWTETMIDSEGKVTGKDNRSGLFTIGLKQPTSQQEILQNPLGIIILDFNIADR